MYGYIILLQFKFCMSFYNSDDIKELHKEKECFCEGYCIIVDIKDSTKRKQLHKREWELHTKSVYRAFLHMIDTIVNNSTKECGNEQLERITQKFTGDGGMAFLKNINTDPLNQPLISWNILYNIHQYINDTKDKSEALSALNIRVVITYLTGIYIMKFENFSDVIGRGIDFSFRIEKYAAPSHIVVNELFYNSVKEYLKKDKNERFDLHEILCNKTIKGWNTKGENFYLLSNKTMFEDAIESIIPSEHEENVNIELFKWFIKLNNNDNVSVNQNNVWEKKSKDNEDKNYE